MSKTTIVLFIFLFIFIGILLYIVYGNKNESFISSIAAPIRNVVTPVNTSLSFSTNTQFIQPGQTVTLAVIIHSPNPHPALVQLEISYDPTIFTVDSLMPGPFFTNPTAALEKIDPVAGRISYALRCPDSNRPNTPIDCANTTSSTIAVITLSTNPFAYKHTTTLSFLPKTVVRTGNGRDLLQETSSLTVPIGKSLYPVASTSAISSPGSNYLRVTPIR